MLILGAGGHAREVFDLLLNRGYKKTDIFFVDTRIGIEQKPQELFGRPILSELSFQKKETFIIGTGNPELRETLFRYSESYGHTPQTMTGKTALISTQEVQMEDAVLVMEMCYIGPSVFLGKGTLVNTGAQIHHDCTIGKFCEICPGVHLSGGCVVEDGVLVGTGAVILPGIHVGVGAKIGAGAVVTQNVLPHSTVVGNPAKQLVRD